MPRLIVGLVGCAGSGKSTVAQHLVHRLGFTQLSFASSLKDCAAAIFGWSRADLEGESEAARLWREAVDPWWSARLGIPYLTPRWVLRHLGTEVMRHNFHEEVWIASLQRRMHVVDTPIVVSDLRFPNEVQAILDVGGVVIRIERPGWEASGHITETALADCVADDVLVNSGSVKDLRLLVDKSIEGLCANRT